MFFLKSDLLLEVTFIPDMWGFAIIFFTKKWDLWVIFTPSQRPKSPIRVSGDNLGSSGSHEVWICLHHRSHLIKNWAVSLEVEGLPRPPRFLPHPCWRKMKALQTTPHNGGTSSGPNGLWATAFVPWLARLFKARASNCIACLATRHYSTN